MLSSVEDPQTDLKTVKSFQSPLFPAEDSGPVERPLWSHYHKPIFVLVIGGLVLCTGVALSLVSSEKNSVPQVLGPVFLSIGLMFILVAVVWFPIIKDKLKPVTLSFFSIILFFLKHILVLSFFKLISLITFRFICK
ncbi:phosphoinositide-interacting protein-like [Astyanax mexicanus]|uniref:Phosphoinositide-interacting protein-like n=1 Tax=Astyanax mexicanus TaxID=7994 RepID=A0A8T2L8P6_ASTMX|nr:phosphoinositide-interacting protein-like [Astyanax mexicanus]